MKIYLLQKSADEILEAFSWKLSEDTNTLIDISSRDSHMRKLASGINGQLRLLRRERQRFQQGDQELKDAVTNISHDLRTPLTTICGYLDLLENEDKNDTVQRYLSQIRNRAETLNTLTEELFRYSVVLSSREWKPEQVNLTAILEENLLSFYEIMLEKGIQPAISLPEAPVLRNLDKNSLNRIFSNIISNAIKYSDGDFSVTMNTEGTIVFSNTARALNQIAVGRLFDRFYTVETNRNSAGLGLSIARLLTERMGGSIRADYRDDRLFITVEFLTDIGRAPSHPQR